MFLQSSSLKNIHPLLSKTTKELSFYTDRLVNDLSGFKSSENIEVDPFYLNVLRLFGFEVTAEFIWEDFISTLGIALNTNDILDMNLKDKIKMFKAKRRTDRSYVFYSIKRDEDILITDLDLYENFLMNFYAPIWNYGVEDDSIVSELEGKEQSDEVKEFIEEREKDKEREESFLIRFLKTREIDEKVFNNEEYHNMITRSVRGLKYHTPNTKEVQELLLQDYKYPPNLGKIVDFFVRHYKGEPDVLFFFSLLKLFSYLEDENLIDYDDHTVEGIEYDNDIFETIKILKEASDTIKDGSIGRNINELEVYRSLYEGYYKDLEDLEEEEVKQLYSNLADEFDRYNSFEEFAKNFNLFEFLNLNTYTIQQLMYDYLSEKFSANSKDYISSIFYSSSIKGRRKQYIGNRNVAIVRGYKDILHIDTPIYYFIDPVYNSLPLGLKTRVQREFIQEETNISYLSETHCRLCNSSVGNSIAYRGLIEHRRFTPEEASITIGADRRCCVNTMNDRTYVSRLNPYSTEPFRKRVINRLEDIDDSMNRLERSRDVIEKVKTYLERVGDMIPGTTMIIGEDTYKIVSLVYVGSGFITPKITRISF